MKKQTQSAQLRQTQYLQTVAVEASNQLRSQSIGAMQTQAIRLEDLAETEIETAADTDKCMDELMHVVLFTELRREIREISDSLDGMQFQLVCNSGRPTRTVSKQTALLTGSGSGDVVPEVVEERSEDDTGAGDADEQMPRPLSPSETFRTARGIPFPEPAENGTDNDQSVDTTAANGDEQEDPEKSLEELEHRLYNVCIEVVEWRRTHCIKEFIASMEAKDAGLLRRDSRPSSVLSFGAKMHPVEHIIGQMRDREQKKRTSSLGNAVRNGLSYSLPADVFDPLLLAPGEGSSLVSAPPPMPPLSRLLEVERELEATRLSPRQRRRSSNESRGSVAHGSNDGVISPSGRRTDTHQGGNLRLIGSPSATSPHRASIADERRASEAATTQGGRGHPQTFVDDVRIIGWVTRGRGLDVHTEFKVVVHLTRGDNLTVMRRYTDFEILREVVCQRYRTFRKRVPHLPQKKAFGKFEDSFLKKRESGLQFFLAYVMLHPVIGCSMIIRQWIEGVP
ncbi:hypothetical protein EV175_002268 [Coemansia sp. RSA 1933]|nr:hypothetical protein EV175_002268 [Coemansia sp. RSA 1933]